jgi:hypothetical protein
MNKTDLERTIEKIERKIRALARAQVPGANVFSFGATEIDPKHLAIWITTNKDQQRDALRNDCDFHSSLVSVLRDEGYPADAISQVAFAFESEETVQRDYEGNWWYVVK